MARVKISEYKAKQLVYKHLGFSSNLISLDANNSLKLNNLDPKKSYVVKVDQGVKGRFKKGLVSLDKPPQEVKTIINSYKKLGFNSFLVEEFIPHAKNQEKYISIERVKDGKLILYSNKGGIDIEKNIENVKKLIIKDDKNLKEIANFLEVNTEFLKKIINLYDELYFSFLEINPLVIKDKNIYLLDLAVEVDSTAEFFVNGFWEVGDFVSVNPKTKEEEEIINLSAKSQAAFKLDVLNPNGSIFMLLSGGGASIVLADEIHNQGFSKELANYGEYSGNPNEEETYIYTKNLLSLLLKSKAEKKVLIIGGGVANFTDIRITFKGIIKALEEVKDDLRKQEIKVFVRRGGPHQKAGLKDMESFLKKENLLGKVSGPEMVLTDIVLYALNYLKK
ncbi:MAG: hypothetical protein ACD_37C00298G0003 [uncultured bacterium]|nr:MAG: hypothetical protein ACD_37C00298G0003 [uncultured bacterium]